MKKIAVSTASFCEYNNTPISLFREKGYKVAVNAHRRKLKPDELARLAKDAVGLIAGTEPITTDVLSKLPFLRAISRCGTGIDNIDMEAARRFRINVSNTPDAPTQAVAELTVGLMLGLLRKISQSDAAIRIGKWEKRVGNLLSGKRVGIIGFGRIGRRVAELLGPFACEIRFTDPCVKKGLSGFRTEPLEKLLKWADILSIHASTKDEIIGSREFKIMRKGAWLVNVSRGNAVNEAALYSHLKKGRLSGAALDVFSEEPYRGSLRKLDNLLLTAHIGSYAKEARIKMEIEAATNLLKDLEG